MDKKITTHQHRYDKTKKLRGRALQAGDLKQEGDMYDCSDGNWRKLPTVFVGSPMYNGGAAQIIRPVRKNKK